MSSITYLPTTPRVWSRVQNAITMGTPDTNTNAQTYVPILDKSVSYQESDYYDKLLYKGNILQHKKNSFQLSQNQQYSRIANGFSSYRTRSFATQTQTYCNPNTLSLLRVNSTQVPYNDLVGSPNNPSGPFQYGDQVINDCSNNFIEIGGNLVCGIYADKCSGEILKVSKNPVDQWTPNYCSDVPGPFTLLYWNPKFQSYFPSQTRQMNTSLDKFPQGYKGFTNSINLPPPILSIEKDSTTNAVTLSWTNPDTICSQTSKYISSYNIYQNNVLINTIAFKTTSTIIRNLISKNTYTFYVTSIFSGSNIESSSSNVVSIYIT